jgi:hypothetical protein
VDVCVISGKVDVGVFSCKVVDVCVISAKVVDTCIISDKVVVSPVMAWMFVLFM